MANHLPSLIKLGRTLKRIENFLKYSSQPSMPALLNYFPLFYFRYSLVRSGKVRHVCLVQLAFAQEIVDSPMISVVRMQVQPNIDQ